MEYEVRIKALRLIDGVQKKVTEMYLVDGMTASEVETKILDELAPGAEFGGIEVDKIAKKKFSELFIDKDCEKFYTVKVGLITLDESTNTEKKTAVTMLFQANDFNDALKRYNEAMDKSVMDYVTIGVNEAPYLDYIK